jgi:integrase
MEEHFPDVKKMIRYPTKNRGYAMPTYKYALKDGKTMWYAAFNYTDWTGKYRHTCKRGFKTQREAKEYERSFLDQQSVNNDILFSSLVENYMEDMSHRLKPTTMGNKKNIIDTKVLPYFKNLKICDIDALKIRKWQNEMISSKDDDGNPFSQTYLKTINNQMSAIMNYAVRHYHLRSNPCRTAGSMGKSKAGKMLFWTHDQYNAFIATEKKSAYKLAFDILFYSGIREGELLALTPSDVLDSKKLSINKNFATVDSTDLVLIPKTSKSFRDVPIPDFLYNDINDYILRLGGIQPEDRIFYFKKTALQKEIKRGAKEAGVPLIRVHDLRHSHASLLINMDVSIFEISERLGHESVKTTMDIYAHLYPEKERQLIDKLNQIQRPERS